MAGRKPGDKTNKKEKKKGKDQSKVDHVEQSADKDEFDGEGLAVDSHTAMDGREKRMKHEMLDRNITKLLTKLNDKTSGGHFVIHPGTYTLHIGIQGDSQTQRKTVKLPPRSQSTRAHQLSADQRAHQIRNRASIADQIQNIIATAPSRILDILHHLRVPNDEDVAFAGTFTIGLYGPLEGLRGHWEFYTHGDGSAEAQANTSLDLWSAEEVQELHERIQRDAAAAGIREPDDMTEQIDRVWVPDAVAEERHSDTRGSIAHPTGKTPKLGHYDLIETEEKVVGVEPHPADIIDANGARYSRRPSALRPDTMPASAVNAGSQPQETQSGAAQTYKTGSTKPSSGAHSKSKPAGRFGSICQPARIRKGHRAATSSTSGLSKPKRLHGLTALEEHIEEEVDEAPDDDPEHTEDDARAKRHKARIRASQRYVGDMYKSHGMHNESEEDEEVEEERSDSEEILLRGIGLADVKGGAEKRDTQLAPAERARLTSVMGEDDDELSEDSDFRGEKRDERASKRRETSKRKYVDHEDADDEEGEEEVDELDKKRRKRSKKGSKKDGH